MRRVVYLRYKPTNQTCTLFTTNADGSNPETSKSDVFLSRFFIDYVLHHSRKVTLADFELGEYEENETNE